MLTSIAETNVEFLNCDIGYTSPRPLIRKCKKTVWDMKIPACPSLQMYDHTLLALIQSFFPLISELSHPETDCMQLVALLSALEHIYIKGYELIKNIIS